MILLITEERVSPSPCSCQFISYGFIIGSYLFSELQSGILIMCCDTRMVPALTSRNLFSIRLQGPLHILLSLSLSFAFWHKKLFQAHPICSFPNLQWVLFPRNSASLLWTWYFRKQDLSAGWVYASLEDSIASRISQQTTQSRARNQMSVCV